MATNTERPDAGAGEPTTTTTRTTGVATVAILEPDAALPDGYSRGVAKGWFTECLTTMGGSTYPTDRAGTGRNTGSVCFTKTEPQLDQLGHSPGNTTSRRRSAGGDLGFFGLHGLWEWSALDGHLPIPHTSLLGQVPPRDDDEAVV